MVANLVSFLAKAEIQTQAVDVTTGFSRNNGKFEWASTSPGTMFCQGANLLSGRMWRLLLDVIRFNQFATDLLHQADFEAGHGGNSQQNTEGAETIGEYLHRQGYSDAFRNDYLLPLTLAAGGSSPEMCSLACPAAILVRFL